MTPLFFQEYYFIKILQIFIDKIKRFINVFTYICHHYFLIITDHILRSFGVLP